MFFVGRVDPVPFEQKDDHMGLGRWTMEVRDIGQSLELKIDRNFVVNFIRKICHFCT